MRNRNIVFLLIFAVIVYFGYYVFTRDRTPTVADLPLPTPGVEEQIEGIFDINIPEDIEKIELKSVNNDGLGVATKEAILADLPDPSSENYYQAWLSDGSDYKRIGVLREAKGGFLLEYSILDEDESYNKIIISEESAVTSTPTKSILEGEFE